LRPLAYNVNDKLSVGGSLDYVWAMLDMKMAMPGNVLMGLVEPTSTMALPGVPTVGRLEFSDDNDLHRQGEGYRLGRQARLCLQGQSDRHHRWHLPFQDLPGRPRDQLVGAAYSSKLNFSKMDDYSGLFANGGDFDIPENYNLGIAFQVNPKTTVAVDLQRINYSKVGSVSNSSSNLGGCMFGDMSMCLGGSNGAGFGWRDVNVFKLGVEHAYSDKLVVRAGYNHGTNPIRSADVTFNMLAPGVIEDHLSLGFTYAASNGGEWTMAYTHAFENEVSGTSFLTNFGAPPTTAEKIKMHQDAIGIAYSWKM
jgi:long-subunit fatty acid transport protein